MLPLGSKRHIGKLLGWLIRWIHSAWRTQYDKTSPVAGVSGRVAHRDNARFDSVEVEITEQLQHRAAIDRFHGRVRSLANRLEHLREQERGELAQKLHGTLRQDMTTLKLEIDSLRAGQPPGAAADARLSRVAELAEQCLNRLRHIAFELQPPGIEDLGLIGAIRRYADECAAETGLQIEVMAADPIPDLGRQRSIVLYRTVQEALLNVIRHARARRVEISLSVHEGSVRLRISDDGIGMGESDHNKADSLGLLAASERLSAIGGTLRVFAVAGDGTTLHASVPLRRMRRGPDQAGG